MTRRVALTLACVACELALLAQTVVPPAATKPEATAVTVPLELVAGRPVLPVRVNGAGPFRFLLDPLAPVTRLDAGLVDELGLKRRQGPNRQSLPTYGVELRVDTLAIPGVGAEPVDMAPLVPGFGPATRPRGVIGGAAWQGRLLTFDFSAWRVSVSSGELPAADGASVFAIDASDIASGIPIEIAGRRLTAALDVLFAGGLVLPETIVPRPPLVKGAVVVRPMPTRVDVIGTNEAQLLGDLSVTSVVLPGPMLLFSRDVHVPTLGTAWLNRFVVIIDGGNRRARLVPRRGA